MDPNNERRVFDLVVETVCRPNTSQYFLITPKLLPDLRYVKGMHVLTVLNGHWMVPHQEFHLNEFIKKKRALKENNGRTVAVRWVDQTEAMRKELISYSSSVSWGDADDNFWTIPNGIYERGAVIEGINCLLFIHDWNKSPKWNGWNIIDASCMRNISCHFQEDCPARSYLFTISCQDIRKKTIPWFR